MGHVCSGSEADVGFELEMVNDSEKIGNPKKKLEKFLDFCTFSCLVPGQELGTRVYLSPVSASSLPRQNFFLRLPEDQEDTDKIPRTGTR